MNEQKEAATGTSGDGHYCPDCGRRYVYGNFCTGCRRKMVETCECWVLKRQYNCGFDKCPGHAVKVKAVLEAV